MSEEPKFAPKCIWCSAPWSDLNIKVEHDVSTWGSDSMGTFTELAETVSIVCHACKREMYRKEMAEVTL